VCKDTCGARRVLVTLAHNIVEKNKKK